MTSTPKKTLTLKKKPRSADDTTTPRQRSGARARQAQQMQRLRDNISGSDTPESTPTPAAPRRPQSTAKPQRAPTGYAPASKRPAKPDTPKRHRIEGPKIQARFTAQRDDEFTLFAPCPVGLEEALATELQALGFAEVSQGRAGCHFLGNWHDVLRANLYSRLATRILVQMAFAPIQNEDELYELAYQTPWENWFGAEQTLRVDTSAIRSPFQSLQYANLRVKDAICDRLRDREGARPDIDTVRPDAKVHAFLNEDSATLYIDSSGESLFKRGWRHDKGDAPLRENLASGLLALADWDPNQPLIDPFCGSGTILIEAAWIALGAPPGIARPFHFERLRHHDARAWQDLKAEARAHIAAEIEVPLLGSDLSPGAIAAARANLARAHLPADTIQFEVKNALDIQPVAPKGWIITNPPYGERLDDTDTEFWSDWASHLKRNFSGWSVNVITSDLELPSKLRLKPNRRFPLFNGPLDCRLFNFQMVAASNR
ncbi:RNA methyltransferase [Paenalcaligenes hominis]|uniref:RNA methyltransferase n=1 Tax=Paenalcaligenes hominis TaxID=643674 RepID=A0A1U9JZ43_9BURK|nr:THUMP domain-containing protein [Paenalcaligenes hominis]AQS51073.1 RNA methyltransferase [Paenalcaligenes hominis]